MQAIGRKIRARRSNLLQMKAFFSHHTQYALGLKTELRTNIDYTIFREPNVRNNVCCNENLRVCSPTFDVFRVVNSVYEQLRVPRLTI
jgi:hypothetical protein